MIAHPAPLSTVFFLFFFAVDDPAPVGETEHGPLKPDMLGSVWTEMSEGKFFSFSACGLARHGVL
jgi:hypothetical protein